MRRVYTLLLAMLALAACQTAVEPAGPRAIVEWQPEPYGERTLPTVPTLPAPEIRQPESITLPRPQEIDLEPVIVPTLAPTPTPPYQYASQASGFTVPYPSSWEVLESDDSSVRLYDPGLEVQLNIFSEFKDEDFTYEEMVNLFVEDENDIYGKHELLAEEETAFAGDGTAETAWLTQIDGNGRGVWLAYAENESHAYRFYAFGSTHHLQARRTTLATILNQVRPGGRSIYGLDPDETLVMLGGDPIPRSLDPARTTGGGGYILMLYSGLVRLSSTLQVEPDLAESWTVSDDGTVYTFTLRENLSFQSGKPIVADDFKQSWERAADPKTDSTVVATYLGDIVGVKEMLNGEAESIAGVRAVDDRTLEVTLDGPKPYFLHKLTYPTSFVVDMDSVDPDDEEWVWEPNASGPYILSEHHEDAAIILQRNESFYDPPSIPNHVYLLYRVGSRISLFESGEVDIVYPSSSEVQRIRQPEDELHDRWVSNTSMCTSYVLLNNTLPPLDDPNVRLALALSVDKEALNELLTEGLDVVATSILPPAMPGFSAERSQSETAVTFDPEAAQAALAASSYADGLPTLTFKAGGYGTSQRDDLDALISGWGDVLGLEVEVQLLDPQDYSRVARETEAHLTSYGWCADYPDPENFLDVLFHSESEFNVAGYSNPEIDALLEEARTELDPARRLALYQEIETALLADTAAIPFRHSVIDVLVSERVNGFVLSPMGEIDLRLLTLSEVEEGE